MSGNSLPESLVQGAAQGLFLSLWIIGTAMLILVIGPSLSRRMARRRRIRRYRDAVTAENHRYLLRYPVVRRLAADMEFAEWKAAPEWLLSMMLAVFLIGSFGAQAAVGILQQHYATGADRFVRANPWLMNLFAGSLLASLPLFYLKFRVQKKRNRIATRMIMLVQNIIGHYNPALTLNEMLVKASGTMPADVRREWNRLVVNLHMQTTQEALHDFAKRIDNHWADDLADLLLMGAHYGTDITEALHKLVAHMQTAKSNEEKRMAMITAYRIGTTLMVGFAAFVVLFNIYADTGNFRHYFLEPGGKKVMTISIVVLFASLLMVVRSGRKPF
ncbi:type II secretion system F family protein [Gorillibacterium timonense]|uniref:type II secretion system F family protein n=1 Tax=Gorillibacterium timonense TaxID=1689269 RepID=UPI00071C469E|nr:hypothetical protein [Gorillibacterium timonense]